MAIRIFRPAKQNSGMAIRIFRVRASESSRPPFPRGVIEEDRLHRWRHLDDPPAPFQLAKPKVDRVSERLDLRICFPTHPVPSLAFAWERPSEAHVRRK